MDGLSSPYPLGATVTEQLAPPPTVTSADIARVVEGQTVARQFLATVARTPDAPALRRRDGDGWVGWTYQELADRVARATAGFRALGVGPGDRVVLMLRNRPEFHVLDLAVLFCGATPISIYNSSSPDQIAYLVGHSKACVGVIEDARFLEQFGEVRHELPTLRALGVVDPPADVADEEVFTYDDLLAHDPADLEQAAEVGSPDDLATVIYTSGTTGPPKGVMISNANVCWTNECLRLALQFDSYEGKRMVSYLPMAHIAERMNSHYQMVAFGYEVVTCPEPGQLAAYLRDVRPQVMFGVPRVYEKMFAGVSAGLAKSPENAAKFAEGIELAAPIALHRAWGEATPEELATAEVLDDLAFRGTREALGLDQLDAAISGAAPIPADLLAWFNALGVPLSEIYGMSESCGPITWAARRIKPGTVGPAVPGCEVALDFDGEVICRGGNVFVGYLDDPEKTAEALDADGWLHTGDIGEFDDDGYLRIVDRKKELIITAGGKNVSPANLEAAIKSSVPLVGQACAIGDDRPFISALLTLDPDVAPVWAAQHDIAYATLDELADRPEVRDEVQRGVDTAMAEFNGAERVKKFTLLGEEWLPDSEVLTPTSKLKRRGINSHYANEIDAMYG
jgi:long-chain acyl-CoA synthetase